MTAAVPTRDSSGGSDDSSGWLFGPAPDLLLGCGLLYAALLGVFLVAGDSIRIDQAKFVFPLLLMIFAMPHYGGTLVRVYEERASRRNYAIFSVWSTLGVLALFIWSLHNAFLGSVLFTVYITWSPWHYTGQNYGLTVMFLRRNGVAVRDRTKRLLYSTFMLSYGMVFLGLHRAGGRAPDVMVSYSVNETHFLPIGLPTALADPAFAILTLAYLAALVGLVFALRGAPIRAKLTTASLVATQALWFSIPFVIRVWHFSPGVDALSSDYRGYYFIWIALAHSIQYLWVTTFYARASGAWTGYASYFGKVTASGIAVWTVPVLLFAPDAIGPLSYDAGLALLVSAAVNLHHFILDGAIWKLRNIRIARILLRSSAVDDEGQEGARRPQWTRRAVWSIAAGAVAAAVLGFWWEFVSFDRAMRDGSPAAAAATLDRMAWVGRDDWIQRLQVARSFAQRGENERAAGQYERSLALQASPAAYAELGKVALGLGDNVKAAASFEAALELSPNRPDLLVRAAEAFAAMGQEARARELLARFDRLPGNRTKDAQRLRRDLNRNLGSDPGVTY